MDAPLPPELAARSDTDLLRRYLESRDAAALTVLITRHAALVRGICQRVLGNTPDADDAFQATFLVLIRRGERILKPVSLAAWLYGVAHRIACRQRRQQRPAIPIHEGHAMAANDPLTELAIQHDASLFDAALARLPEKYRAPIVLHHLEGKSHREVAAELKLTESAVDGLLKRGRNELRVRLARQGVVLGVTLAAVEAGQEALAAAAHQPLIESTVQELLAYDPILHPQPTRSNPVRLAQQEISTMGLLQPTKAIAWGIAGTIFLGAAGIGVAVSQNHVPINAAGMISSALLASTGDDDAEVTANRIAAPDQEQPASASLDKTGDDAASATEATMPAELRVGMLSEHPIFAAMEKETQFRFVDTPVLEALKQIFEPLGQNVYIDEGQIQADNLANSLIAVVNLELSGIKLRNALKLILEPHALDYIIEDELLRITSQKAAESHHEMRIYKAVTLTGQKLESLVKDAIGGRWKPPGSDGPGGTIQWTSQGLAVRHNQRAHLAIEKFLAKLANDAISHSDSSADVVAEPQEIREVAGVITEVDQPRQMVRLSVGSDDGVKQGMRFKIAITKDGKQQTKGTIQIVRVDADAAEARIVEQDYPNQIAVNDSLHSPEPPRSHAGEVISIIGDVDLDGDGKSDREMFHQLLKDAGIEVENEVNDAGDRTGEKLSERSKFLVFGKIPDARGGGDREHARARKVLTLVRDLQKEAQLSGVRMIHLNDYLDYIGQPKSNPIPDTDLYRPLHFREYADAEGRTEAALQDQTEISFTDTSLIDALEYIEDLHGIQILIDEDNIVEDGGSVDGTITLKLQDVSLKSALNFMLDPLDLDYVIKDGFMLITTANLAAHMMELRIYDLTDFKLMLGEFNFTDEIVDERHVKAIKEAVGGEWGTDGGSGTIVLTPGGVIVRHNQRMHREFENLIRQLRKARE